VPASFWRYSSKSSPWNFCSQRPFATSTRKPPSPTLSWVETDSYAVVSGASRAHEPAVLRLRRVGRAGAGDVPGGEALLSRSAHSRARPSSRSAYTTGTVSQPNSATARNR
jgi:hypothetical protein